LSSSSVPSILSEPSRTPVLVSHQTHHNRFHDSTEKIAQTLAHSADGLCLCPACVRAKSKAPSAPSEARHPATELGGRLFLDLDIVNVTSWDRKNLVLVITDEATRSVWTRYLTRKKDVYAVMTDFLVWFRTQFKCAILRCRTDNEPLLSGQPFKSILAVHGIHHEGITPVEHHQNGKVERVIQTLARKAQAYLSDAGAPRGMWAEAHAAAAFVYDRSYHSEIGMSPYEARTGKAPEVSMLRTWGCLAWLFIRDERRQDNKYFADRAEPCVFIGYGGSAIDGIERPGHRFWSFRTRKPFYAPVKHWVEERLPWKHGMPGVASAPEASEDSVVVFDHSTPVSTYLPVRPAVVPARLALLRRLLLRGRRGQFQPHRLSRQLSPQLSLPHHQPRRLSPCLPCLLLLLWKMRSGRTLVRRGRG
jgi:hypothetical protein